MVTVSSVFSFLSQFYGLLRLQNLCRGPLKALKWAFQPWMLGPGHQFAKSGLDKQYMDMLDKIRPAGRGSSFQSKMRHSSWPVTWSAMNTLSVLSESSNHKLNTLTQLLSIFCDGISQFQSFVPQEAIPSGLPSLRNPGHDDQDGHHDALEKSFYDVACLSVARTLGFYIVNIHSREAAGMRNEQVIQAFVRRLRSINLTTVLGCFYRLWGKTLFKSTFNSEQFIDKLFWVILKRHLQVLHNASKSWRKCNISCNVWLVRLC